MTNLQHTLLCVFPVNYFANGLVLLQTRCTKYIGICLFPINKIQYIATAQRSPRPISQTQLMLGGTRRLTLRGLNHPIGVNGIHGVNGIFLVVVCLLFLVVVLLVNRGWC